MSAAADQSFLRNISEARREMVVDTNQCLSFENTNAFRQEYTFGVITNDVSGDDFSYDNSSLMDAGAFVTKLPEKCLELVPNKYYAFRNIILNLSRCNYCNVIRGNIENLNIIRVNVFNINQGSISLFSLLYAYFMCESFSGVVSKCPNKCNNNINQSGKVLLNVSPIFIIQTDRVNQNSSLVNKTELDIPLTLDLSSFIACDLKDDGISPLYRLTSCITYQGAFIKTGHYVCYNIHEDGVTRFNDSRIEYFSSLNEDAMVKRNTHILFMFDLINFQWNTQIFQLYRALMKWVLKTC